MSRAFVLTAQLNIQAPTNLRPVVQSIQQQLGSVKVNIDVKIDPAAATKVAALNTQLTQLSKTLSSITSSTTAIRGLSTALGGLSTSVSATSKAVSTQSNAFTKAKNSIQEARTEIEAFGFQSALAIRRFAAFSVGTAGILGLVGAFKSGISEAIKFDREMVKLSQVTGVSVRGLKGISDEIGRLATTFGVSSSALLDVSTTLAQAGLSARETKVALEALAKSALAPSFDNLKDTTEGVIASMRQFSLQAGDVESALGSINAVSAAFAVESGDIITAIRTTGGVFASASKGVSEGKRALNEFISVFTSVRATTRESAESIATGLRTIFTRIQRPRTIEYLKEFGINLQDLEGKFVGPYEAVRRLSEGLRQLDTRDSRFAQVTEELGGYRQLGKVIPAIQQFATAQQALQVATAGSNSLTRDAETAQQALSVQITKTKEEFLALVRSFAQSTTFTSLISGTLKLADSFIAIGNAIRPILPYLTILAGIKLSSSLFQFGSGLAGGIKRGGGAGGAGSGLASLITGNRGFATGGLVPGYGNSDSYPADLTPGEFVIRKSAVKALGVGTLDNLNKYAGGIGPPKTNPSVRDLLNFTDSVNPKGLSRAEYNKLSDDDKTALKNRYLAAGQGITSPAAEPAEVTKRLTPRNLTVDGPYGGLFFQLGSKSGNVNTGPVSINFKKLSEGDQAKLAELYPQHKIGRISGQPYQFFINKQKGDQFDRLAKDSMEKVIDNILATAGGANAVSTGIGKPIGTIKDIMKKQIGFSAFAGNIFEAYIGAVGNQLNPERSRSFDFNPVNPEFQQLFGSNVGQAKYADAKLTATSKSLPSILKKAVTAKLAGANEIIFRLGSGNADSIAARSGKVESALGDTSNIRRTGRATGGQVGSVKSLLTPGEYVMGAGAAKILGPATLNRLNNADRIGFENGGLVAQAAALRKKYPGVYTPAQALGIVRGQRVDTQINTPGSNDAPWRQGGNRMGPQDDAFSGITRSGDPFSAIKASAASDIDVKKLNNRAAAQLSAFGVAPPAGVTPSLGSNIDFGVLSSASTQPAPTGLNRIRSSLNGGLASANARLGGSAIGGRLAGIGGIAALAAGPLTESLVGRSTPTRGGITGGVSGVAGGALAGAALGGPVGAGIGAVIGGLTGFIQGFKEVQLVRAAEQFEKASSSFDSTVQDFGSGKISAEEQSFKSANLVSAAGSELGVKNKIGIDNTLSTRGVLGTLDNYLGYQQTADTAQREADFRARNRSDNIAQLSPQASKLASAYAQRATRGNDKLDDKSLQLLAFASPDVKANEAQNAEAAKRLKARGKTNPEIEEAIGRDRVLQGQKVKESIDKEIKAQKDLAASAAIANAGLELLSRSFEQISADVQRVLTESDKRSIVTEDLLGQSAGVARVGRVASNVGVFENNRAYSADETAAAFKGLGLNKGSTKKLTDTALSTKALSDELPNFILKSFKADNRTDATPEDAAAKGIDEILKSKGLSKDALPSELRAKILDQVKQGTENTQSSSRGLEGFILEFSKSLDDIGKDVFKAGADLQKGLEAANNKYLEGINQYIGASLRVEEQKASNVGANNADFVASKKLNPNYRDPIGFDAGYQEFGQIKELTKSAANPFGTQSARSIGATLTGLDATRDKINAQRAATPIGDTSAQASLAKSLAQVEVEIAKNSKALDIAANASGELAGITAELTRIEASRKDAQNQLSETQITRREAREAQKGAAIFDRVKNDPSVKLNRRDTDRLTKFGKAEQADLIGLGKFKEADDVATAVARKSLEFKKNNGLLRNQTQEDFLTQGIVGANQSKEAQGLEARAGMIFDNRKAARNIQAQRAGKPLSGVLDNLDKQNTETTDKVRAAGNKLVPDSFSEDVAALQKAASILASIPTKITMEGTHQLAVHVTGLGNNDLESAFGQFINKKINNAIRAHLAPEQLLEGGPKPT